MLSTLSDRDPVEIGGYRLHARLGVGGMGEVYLGFLPGGSPLAIKVVRREYADDPTFRTRFAQEVRAARSVAGQFTAPVLEAGPDAPVPWLATAYVTGPTLLHAVRTSGPLPAPVVRALAAAIASALRTIHACGVIHRDLSPGNVILAADGPKVIDFGIARATDVTSSIVSRTPLGTPGFMAPEVALGQPAVPASDVFALGAIIFFAATGRSPYGEGTFASQLLRLTRGEADLTGCPSELRDLVERCLSAQPADRPTTQEVISACGGPPRLAEGWLPPAIAADIAAREAELARVAAQPVPPARGAAGPAGGPRRLRRWSVAAGVLVALVAAAFVGGKLSSGFSAEAGAGAGDGTGATAAAVSPPPSPTASVTATEATPGQSSPSPSASSPSPSASPPADQVQWTGTIRINGDGIDMDVLPPVVDPSSGRIDLKLGLTNDAESTIDGIDGGYHTSVAILPAGTAASPRACHELISTVGTESVEVRKGSTFCFKTDKGLLGVATITRISGGFGYGNTATATVWATTDFA